MRATGSQPAPESPSPWAKTTVAVCFALGATVRKDRGAIAGRTSDGGWRVVGGAGAGTSRRSRRTEATARRAPARRVVREGVRIVAREQREAGLVWVRLEGVRVGGEGRVVRWSCSCPAASAHVLPPASHHRPTARPPPPTQPTPASPSVRRQGEHPRACRPRRTTSVRVYPLPGLPAALGPDRRVPPSPPRLVVPSRPRALPRPGLPALGPGLVHPSRDDLPPAFSQPAAGVRLWG